MLEPTAENLSEREQTCLEHLRQAQELGVSFAEHCRANGIEPHAYLTHLYTELPKADTLEKLEALLPWNVTKQQLLHAIKDPLPYDPTTST